MNGFLNQFLIESREFVQQATDGLLQLERTPDNAELLDAVFRAFHTLKGGAGIVEFPAMERAVHAAEDVLADARAGRNALTATRIGECLTCLDQVVQWLDTLAQTGELPRNPDAAADAVVGRFSAASAAASRPDASSGAVNPEWAVQLRSRHETLTAPGATAIRYVPDADCFFRGEDPVARLTALPKLLAMELDPATAFPPLGSLDVYRCNLIGTALSAAPIEELKLHMQGAPGEWEVTAINATQTGHEDSNFSAHAKKILTEQLALLRRTSHADFIGRVASAGLTAANVLRACGRQNDAALIAQGTEESLAAQAVKPLEEAITAALVPQSRAAGADPARRTESTNRTLRIDAARIDALVRLTSELTVAKNALGHLLKVARDQDNSLTASLKERHGVLEHLVSELQTQVLGIRVMPLRSVLQRFPRLVREMSANLGKPVHLDVQGDETEADKTIVEMLFEPLLHIVRNAIDHGVEKPELRARRGKPATATLRITAARQADQVVIEVQDDGGGIDLDRVRQVALGRGLVDEERLRALSEAEVVQLIFAPGFSTAETLTELSGRGVGMDAVRSAVERIGGRIAIDSHAGLGTTIRIFLPFSVMMSRVMTVESGGQIFGIPLDAIIETIRVPSSAIANLGAARAIVVRARTIPVVDLATALGVEQSSQSDAEATVVITTSAGQLTGLRVDRLGEQLEVILQPLEGLLAGTPGITGTTLMGDGRVLLVLDIGAMLQ